MFNYFRNKKIRKHIEALQKSKVGKQSRARLEIAMEIDYWQDVISGKIKPSFKYELPNN